VHRIVAATDSGHAVNPQQIEAQVEGSFAYGLSAALFGECTLKDGRIEQENFSTYPVVMMQHMPRVETIVMPSGGFWGGVGEPTIAVAAPRCSTRSTRPTGKRIRELPLKNHSCSEPDLAASSLRGQRWPWSWRAAGAQEIVPYTVEGDGIPAALAGLQGRCRRGRAIVASGRPACASCATPRPFPEERFQGDLAPDLAGAGARYTAAQLRLRVVDPRRLNPAASCRRSTHARLERGSPPPGLASPSSRRSKWKDVVAWLASLR
jgi:hypothetical protein